MSVSWMLLKKSGRQSFARLGLTTVAVALGIVLVCYFTAGVNGLMGRVNGLAINTAAYQAARGVTEQKPIAGVEPLKVGGTVAVMRRSGAVSTSSLIQCMVRLNHRSLPN